MKYLFVIIFVVINTIVLSQENTTFFKQDTLNIHNDTVLYLTDTDRTIKSRFLGGYIYQTDEGLNRIWDTTGQLIMEGVAIKKFKLGFRFSFKPGYYSREVGLWRYYCNGKLVAYKSFDNKGKELSKIKIYNNEQIHEITLVDKYKNPTFSFSKIYFKDGREVVTVEEFVEYLELKKSLNNKCLDKF